MTKFAADKTMTMAGAPSVGAPVNNAAPVNAVVVYDVAIQRHRADAGMTRCVHDVPSGDEAAVVPLPVPPWPIATKTPVPQDAPAQYAAIGIVRSVHVVPSVDVAALVLAAL